MAVRKPKKPDNTLTPTTPTTPTVSNRSLSALPDTMNMSMPDIGSLAPSDWFKASSSIPVLTESEFNAETQKIDGQLRSVEILKGNAQIALGLATAGVTMAKAGKQMALYAVVMEEIKAVGVQLRNAQTATANEEIKVSITAEKGQQLSTQLEGDRIKTQTLGYKNQVDALEGDYYQRLKPLKETEWQQKLDELSAKLGNATGK
jgi:hypothetical protein